MTKALLVGPGSRRLTLALVLMSAFVSALMALHIAQIRALTTFDLITMGAALVIIVAGENIGHHFAAVSWYERRLGAFTLFFFMGLFCTAGTFLTNFAFTSFGGGEKASAQLSSFHSYSDTGKAEEELTAKRRRLEETVAKAPARTAEAAQSAIDGAKAHKWWLATKECTETRGPQTRQFCADFRAAEQDKSNASAAVQARADLTNTENELKSIRDKRAGMKAETTKETASVASLMAFGLSEERARLIEAMMVPTVLQILMVLGCYGLAIFKYLGLPLKPWRQTGLGKGVEATWKATGGELHPKAAPANDVYEQAAASSLKPAPPIAGGVLLGLKQSNIKADWDEEQRRRAQARLQSMTEEAS
jgi:hypothetical protein